MWENKNVTSFLQVESFHPLRKRAEAGVDGVTWQEYEGVLYGWVLALHREIRTGAYRAQPSQRVFQEVPIVDPESETMV